MNELEMTSLLLQLADFGVTGLRVEYSGTDDSGCIDEIYYTKIKLKEDTELNLDTIEENCNELRLKSINYNFYCKIEDFAQDEILDNIEDWWNNEGGYGTLLILIPSGIYKIYNTIYIKNTKSLIHEGALINKTLKK